GSKPRLQRSAGGAADLLSVVYITHRSDGSPRHVSPGTTERSLFVARVGHFIGLGLLLEDHLDRILDMVRRQPDAADNAFTVDDGVGGVEGDVPRLTGGERG